MKATAPGYCERPLVVRCGAFGDMVLLTALLRDLSERFGTDVDVVSSGPWSEPLLRGQPGVGEVLNVRSRKTPYWLSRGQQRVVHALLARGAGPTWCCDGNDAALPMLLRAGIPRRLMVDVRDHPLLPGEHATQQWRRFARVMPPGLATVPSPTDYEAGAGGCSLQVSIGQEADLQGWLRSRGLSSMPLIAIQAGNKRTMRRGVRRMAVNNKYWPHDRWAALLRHLRARHPAHGIVLLGTGPEYRLNADIAALADIAGLHNGADSLPITRLVALLARADGLVTVDSGPAHVAAAVGCPQVVLFGKASTALYRPWGRGGADVRVLTGESDGEPSMRGIETPTVTSAWDALRLRQS